jgi:cytochrome c biogenesis protein CcmG, thiol:disulfide interchange protein DsbE
MARGGIALVIVALVAWGWVNRSRYAPVDTGSRAPDFTAATLTGDSIALSSYRGRVVLLNLWATWCTPCRWEMPSMERLHNELKADGLEVVALSVDAEPGKLDALAHYGGDVAGFVEELGLTFEILRDPEGAVLDRYGVSGLPTSFLIDREGRVQRRIVGPAQWDDDEHVAMVRELLSR